MGFYLRKSFRAGPIRFNLSKSGIGVSGGMTGARLGVTSTGRAYSHVGRYGIYHRQSLSGSSHLSPASKSRATEIEVDLGNLFEAKLAKPASSPPALVVASPTARGRRVVGWAIGILILVAGVSAAGASDNLTIAVGTLAGIVVASRETRAHQAYNNLRNALAQAGKVPIQQVATHVSSALNQAQIIRDGDRIHLLQSFYLDLLRRIVDGGKVESRERQMLVEVETTAGLSEKFIAGARRSIYREGFLGAIADGDVDSVERGWLAEVQSGLGIDDHLVDEERAFVARLLEIQEIQQGHLREISVAVKLKKNEICYFHDVGRKLKWKTLRRFSQDGVKCKEVGYDIEREGELYVTSKRLLLLHDGATSVPMSKILDVEIESDRALVRITKDGAQKPLFFTTPNAGLAAAIIAEVANV